jgi:hypothetical protein
MSNFNTTSNQDQTIIPKDCSYGCNTRIYWSVADNAYLEVFTKQKHICKNRSDQQQKSTIHTSNVYSQKPNYYNKFAKQPKPNMSNSLELLQGSIADVQKKYEILSDIVSEANGKVHGSQSHILAGNDSIPLIVYYEVPEGQRDEIKQKFNSL